MRGGHVDLITSNVHCEINPSYLKVGSSVAFNHLGQKFAVFLRTI